MSVTVSPQKRVVGKWSEGPDGITSRLVDAIEVEVDVVHNWHPEGEPGHWQKETYCELVRHTEQIELRLPPPGGSWPDDYAVPTCFECCRHGIGFRVVLVSYQLCRSEVIARYNVEESG